MTTIEKLNVMLEAPGSTSIVAYRTWLKEILEEQEKYKWHDLRKNPEDLPADWLDNIMTVDTNNQISVHGAGYSSNGRAGGVFAITLKNGEKVYIDETWNNIWSFHLLDDCTHIVAWRYIEPFEEGE